MPIKRPDLVLDETGAFGYPIAFAVYNCTANAGDNTIALSSHGFNEGRPAYLQGVVGSNTYNISQSVPLYIRNPTTNNFQLSLSQTGAIIDITTGGNLSLHVLLGISNVEIATFRSIPADTPLNTMFSTAASLKFDKSYVSNFNLEINERTDSNLATGPFTMSEFFNYGNFGQLRGETGILNTSGYVFNRHFVFSTVSGINYKPESIDVDVNDGAPADVSNFLKSINRNGNRNSGIISVGIQSGSQIVTFPSIAVPAGGFKVHDKFIHSDATLGTGFNNNQNYFISEVVDPLSNPPVQYKLTGIPDTPPVTCLLTGNTNFIATFSVRLNPGDNEVFPTPAETFEVDPRVTRYFRWYFENGTNPFENYTAQEFIKDNNYFRGQFNLGRFNNTYGISLASVPNASKYDAIRLKDTAPSKLYMFVLPNTGVTDEETTNFEARLTVKRYDTGVAANIEVGIPDFFKVVGHGFDTNTEIIIRDNGGEAALTNGAKYFVVAQTTDTFRLSTTKNGTPISFAGAIGTPTTVLMTSIKADTTFNSTRGLIGSNGAKPIRTPSDTITGSLSGVSHVYNSGTQEFTQIGSGVRVFNDTYVWTNQGYFYVVNATDSLFQLSSTKSGTAFNFGAISSLDIECIYHESNTILLLRHNNYLPTLIELDIATDNWYEIYLETKKSALATFPDTVTDTNSVTSFFVYV